jgi:hypothetical protein
LCWVKHCSTLELGFFLQWREEYYPFIIFAMWDSRIRGLSSSSLISELRVVKECSENRSLCMVKSLITCTRLEKSAVKTDPSDIELITCTRLEKKSYYMLY